MFAKRFKMPSASLWASLAERFFYRKKAGKSADFPAFAFHGRELDGKVTGSSTKLTSAPAPLRGAAAAAAEGP